MFKISLSESTKTFKGKHDMDGIMFQVFLKTTERSKFKQDMNVSWMVVYQGCIFWFWSEIKYEYRNLLGIQMQKYLPLRNYIANWNHLVHDWLFDSYVNVKVLFCIGSVMVIMLTSCEFYCKLELQSRQTKDYKIGICHSWLSTQH